MHASKDSMWRKILKNFAKFWELNRHKIPLVWLQCKRIRPSNILLCNRFPWPTFDMTNCFTIQIRPFCPVKWSYHHCKICSSQVFLLNFVLPLHFAQHRIRVPSKPKLREKQVKAALEELNTEVQRVSIVQINSTAITTNKPLFSFVQVTANTQSFLPLPIIN